MEECDLKRIIIIHNKTEFQASTIYFFEGGGAIKNLPIGNLIVIHVYSTYGMERRC